MRAVICSLLVGGVGVGSVVAGCLPNPKADYEDFVDRTESYRVDPSAADSAPPPDAQAPKEAVKGLYFTSCLSQLAFGDVRKLLRFYTVTEYTPSDTGGTLNLTMTPMLGFDPNAGPIDGITGKPSGEFVSPDNFSLTFGRGPAIPAAGTVDGAGVFTAIMGTVELLPEANPISGRPIKIESTVLKGRFASSTDTFCSTLAGQVVVPIQQPLSAPDNICLFVPLKDGDPLPVQVKADFVCNVQ